MNLLDVINEIETRDPAEMDKPNSRRDIFKQISGTAGKIALTALPLGLSGLFQKAQAAGPSNSTTLGILNYALTLEYLESSFYKMGLSVSGLIPTTQEYDAILTIGTHEKEHVAFLQSTIKALGGTPVSEPKFDFTAGAGSGNGPFVYFLIMPPSWPSLRPSKIPVSEPTKDRPVHSPVAERILPPH